MNSNLMQNPSVIITRPLAQATDFAAQVVAAGRSAEIFPLLEIEALSNGFTVHSPLKFNSYAGNAVIGPLEIGQLWPCN